MTRAQRVFPTIEWALAVVSRPVATIAQSQGTTVEEWEEDGLGPSRGTHICLPAGTPIVFIERLLRPDIGTTIQVDASDFSSVGPESLIDDVLLVLGWDRGVITWLQDPKLRDLASRQAKWAVEYREARAARKPVPRMPYEL